MEPFLVADDLDGDKDARLVVDASHDLPKASLAEHIDNLVPIGKMIPRHNRIVSPVVVIAKVGCVGLHVAHHLGGVLSSAKVDVLIIHDFASLVDVEDGNPNGILGAHPLLSRSPLPESIQGPSRQLRLLPALAQLLHLVLGNQVVLVKVGRPDIVVAQGGGRALGLENLLHNRRVVRGCRPFRHGIQRGFLLADQAVTTIPVVGNDGVEARGGTLSSP